MSKYTLSIVLVALAAFGAGCGKQPVTSTTNISTTKNTNTGVSNSNDATTGTFSTNTSNNINTSTTSDAAGVTIENMAFTPPILHVKKGTTVTWTNNDSVTHRLHTEPESSLDSGNLTAGKTYQYTFDVIGTFRYHCHIHPSMEGQVIVE